MERAAAEWWRRRREKGRLRGSVQSAIGERSVGGRGVHIFAVRSGNIANALPATTSSHDTHSTSNSTLAVAELRRSHEREMRSGFQLEWM